MAGIRTNSAAVMLGVSANTLRSWERRFGYPEPRRTPGGHRQYELGQVEALREALAQTHNIASAISLSRERGAGPSSSSRLRRAFAAFDEEAADRLLAESLALRSVERTATELLLPAVASLADDGALGAEYHAAWRHATGWLAAVRRLAPAATRPEGVLVFDAGAPGDLDALHAQALELVLRRAGLRTLALCSAVDPSRLSRAVRALAPRAVVFCGAGVSLEAIGRLVYVVRAGAPGAEVLDYRGALPDSGASTVGRLGGDPLLARDAVLRRLVGEPRLATATTAG